MTTEKPKFQGVYLEKNRRVSANWIAVWTFTGGRVIHCPVSGLDQSASQADAKRAARKSPPQWVYRTP